ncbi:hypothetical protein [Dyella koreensis]|uniref:DUF2946 domain-containing protein n=1 Tax=Dyella koreensis TaxID=311235 RepID=A0ABW8K8Z2_9GAMM
MRKPLRLTRRHRALWIGLVMFCLLFQQLAMAAYVCTLPVNPADVVMTGDCAAMGMTEANQPAAHQSQDPRCTEHCADHTVSSHDARLPMVPPLLLPAASPVMPGTIALAPERRALPDPTLQRPDPPPTLRFCSLLI